MKYLYIFFLLTFITTGCSILYPTPEKTTKRGLEKTPFDAIIVPGVPYDGVHWSGTMKIRVHWSKYLYDNGYAKNIIYSGGAVYSEYIEAKSMALFAEGLGIPIENIFVETKAEHSTENVYYSYLIAKQNGFKSIALATDPFQTNNLRKFIKKYELPVTLLPIVFDTLARLDRYEPKIDPSPAKVDSFVSIVDSQTMKERLRGTLGQRIIWCEDDLKKKRFKKKYKNQMVKCSY